MLGLRGLRIFEATGAGIADLGEEHRHRVLRVCGKGTKIALTRLAPAVGRAIDRAIGARTRGPILLNARGVRMDRHAATGAWLNPRACESSGHTRTRSARTWTRACFQEFLQCAEVAPHRGLDLRDREWADQPQQL